MTPDIVTFSDASASRQKRQNKEDPMMRILLLGLDPETLDFSDPALAPGMKR